MCLETSLPCATSLIIGSHSKLGMYLSLPMYLAFQWSYTYHVHCLRIFTWNSKADFETQIFTDVHDRKLKRNLSSNCLFSRVMILFPSKSRTTLHSVTWKTLEVKKRFRSTFQMNSHYYCYNPSDKSWSWTRKEINVKIKNKEL